MKKELGAIIKRARIQKGMSLRDVERWSGISQTMVSQVERGVIKRPSFTTVVLLSRGLRLDLLSLAKLIRSPDDAVIQE